jgi:hypothetical protein
MAAQCRFSRHYVSPAAAAGDLGRKPFSQMHITIQEREPARSIATAEELDAILENAAAEAREHGMLNLIFLEADNGNAISMVVGGDETVLGFNYSHMNPPYYTSRGSSNAIQPVLTCYGSFQHHTEFPRKCVISMKQGRAAVHEFLATGALPECIAWEEV